LHIGFKIWNSVIFRKKLDLQLSYDLLVQFQRSFFLFYRGCEELYNKKMLIKIESQDYEIIAKMFFF
jgi:hypothetical protein